MPGSLIRCLRRALEGTALDVGGFVVSSFFRNPTREGDPEVLRSKGTGEDGLASNRRWLCVHVRRISQVAIRDLVKSISERTDPRERVGRVPAPFLSANVKLLQPVMLAGGK